jgi:hypothetical protein
LSLRKLEVTGSECNKAPPPPAKVINEEENGSFTNIPVPVVTHEECPDVLQRNRIN